MYPLEPDMNMVLKCLDLGTQIQYLYLIRTKQCCCYLSLISWAYFLQYICWLYYYFNVSGHTFLVSHEGTLFNRSAVLSPILQWGLPSSITFFNTCVLFGECTQHKFDNTQDHWQKKMNFRVRITHFISLEIAYSL